LSKELDDIRTGAQINPQNFENSLGRYLLALESRAKTSPNGMADLFWHSWEVGDKTKTSVWLSQRFDPLIEGAASAGALPAASLETADRVIAAACSDAVYEDEYTRCSTSSRILSQAEQRKGMLQLASAAGQRADTAAGAYAALLKKLTDEAPMYRAAQESFNRGDIAKQREMLESLYRNARTEPSYAADLVESLVVLGRIREALDLIPEALRLNRRRPDVTMIITAYQALATDLSGKPAKAIAFARQAASQARNLKEAPKWGFGGGVIELQRTQSAPQREIDLIRAFAQAKRPEDMARALDRYSAALEH
jgi:tetratricopeptide (TPR) repeat protein